MARNIVVGFISSDRVPADFVASLLSLLAQRSADIKNRVIHVQGFAGRLDVGRHIVAKTFMEQTDGEYLLMLDDDTVFGVHDYDRLIQAAENLENVGDIVSGLYARIDGTLCVFDLTDEGYKPTSPNLLAAQRFYPAGAVGLGFCLVHREVFDSLSKRAATALPWFEIGAEGPGRLADDTSFCYRAVQAGFSVFVDTKTQIGHSKTVTMYPKIESTLTVPEKKLVVPA
jgi:hypothetical protein